MELALIILGIAVVLIVGIGLFAHSPRSIAKEAAQEAAQESKEELLQSVRTPPETAEEKLKKQEILAESDNEGLA